MLRDDPDLDFDNECNIIQTVSDVIFNFDKILEL